MTEPLDRDALLAAFDSLRGYVDTAYFRSEDLERAITAYNEHLEANSEPRPMTLAEYTVSFAQQVPGSRVLLVAGSFQHAAHMVESAISSRQIEGVNRTDVWSWRLSNGAVIHGGYIRDYRDAVRYAGYEFQLVALATEIGDHERGYLNSRLRAYGEVREMMKANGIDYRMVSMRDGAIHVH